MRGRVAAAALIAVTCARTAAAVTLDELPRGGVYKLRAIRIEGNARVSASAIRGVMLSKVAPWYKPWVPRPTFNPALLRTDLARVEALLRESGFYEAHVAHDLDVGGDDITLVLRV